ncbi:MAG: YDG domain-containing protein, partial [Candidatus Bathyarchaeota archaeon]|nr:YDG domain-containing protein [Candidatus Bathyarchaeota archaeon]
TLTMTNKPYDGTTVFIGTVTPGTLAGIQGSDEITINAHASYDTAAVGTDKTITVTYTLGGTDAGNYIKPVDTTQVATISKKQVAISGTTITETKVYDGTNSIEVISLGVIEGVLGSDQVSVTATATYDDISAGVDKPITIRYSLQGENAGNYQISDDTSRKASITKATYDMSGITFNDYTVTYDGNQKRLSITGELPSGVEVFYTNNAKTNVGEYQVTASFTGDSTNYEAIADRSATLTIEKAPMTGSVSITGTALNGEVLTAVPVLTNTGTLTYQWNRGETAISGATGNTYVLVSADIGFTITVTATAGGLNYQGSITSSATAPVKDPDVVAISTDIAALAFDDFNFISGDTSTSVRNSFSVPGNGDNGTTISWQEVSDSESVISINSGTVEVKRPFGNDDNDASVTIRAIVSKGTAAPQTKDFTLTVLDVILMGQSTYGYRLAMNQSIGDIFYLEGDYSTIAGVHTLRNGSVEWETLISTGLPNGSKTANYGSSIASDSAGTVYVLTKVDDINTKIYSLADGAATWTQVGNEDFAAGKSQTGNTGKIVVDSLGKPYAMVNIGFGFKVFELVDTVWSDISPVATSYKSDLFADGPDLYYVTYNYSGGGFVVYKRSSNTWSQIASGIDITGDRNAYPSISAFGNIVTLAVAQANDSVKVMRYDGENWTELSNLMPNIAVNQGTNAHMQSLTVGTTSYIVAFEVVGTDFGTVSRYENGAWT